MGDHSVRIGIEEIKQMDSTMQQRLPELYGKIQEYVKNKYSKDSLTITTPFNYFIPTDTQYVKKGLSMFVTEPTVDENGVEKLSSFMLGDKDFEGMELSQEERQSLQELADESPYVDHQE